MHRMDELVLGLKSEARHLLEPNLKVIWGLNFETDETGEITDIGIKAIEDEPVRRDFWQQISTADWQHIDIQIWVFPFRSYYYNTFQTVYRRVEFRSEVLKTCYVSVVEIIDQNDQLVPESVWSGEEIANAVREIEEQMPLAVDQKFTDLISRAWEMAWTYYMLETAAGNLGLETKGASRGDMFAIFRESWRMTWADEGFSKELKSLLDKAGPGGESLFETYSKYLVEEISATAKYGCRDTIVSLKEGARLLLAFFLDDRVNEWTLKECEQVFAFVERINKINITNLSFYARGIPCFCFLLDYFESYVIIITACTLTIVLARKKWREEDGRYCQNGFSRAGWPLEFFAPEEG